jgi:hypothetical protein
MIAEEAMRISSTVLATVKPPELTYNIASGMLQGRIDKTSITTRAGSGGRAGSKTPGALNWWLANNPFATGVKLPKDKHHSGGPLPMGRYRVVPHEKHPDMLRLLPFDAAQMNGRNGMLIHGRGPRGSDGCIVPTDFAAVQLLCSLVKARQDQGEPAVILQVIAEGQDLDRQLLTA